MWGKHHTGGGGGRGGGGARGAWGVSITQVGVGGRGGRGEGGVGGKHHRGLCVRVWWWWGGDRDGREGIGAHVLFCLLAALQSSYLILARTL